MYCQKCGNSLENGESFCQRCGAKAEGNQGGLNYNANNQGNYQNMNNQGSYTNINNNPSNHNTTKNPNNKNLLIAVGGIILVIIVFNLFKGNSKSSFGDYNASDVEFRCSSFESGTSSNVTTDLDFVFNHNNYQLVIYGKMVIKPHGGVVTDDYYKKYVDSLNAVECLDRNCSAEDHLELTATGLGWIL